MENRFGPFALELETLAETKPDCYVLEKYPFGVMDIVRVANRNIRRRKKEG